jgi:hypothetical protein
MSKPEGSRSQRHWSKVVVRPRYRQDADNIDGLDEVPLCFPSTFILNWHVQIVRANTFPLVVSLVHLLACKQETHHLRAPSATWFRANISRRRITFTPPELGLPGCLIIYFIRSVF